MGHALSCSYKTQKSFCNLQERRTFINNCPAWINAVKHGESTIRNGTGADLPALDLYTLQDFKDRQKCLDTKRSGIDMCIKGLQPRCDNSMVRSVKLLRTRMAAMEATLKYDPTTLILHIIRDPRGTMMSRKKVHHLAKSLKGSMSKEGGALCRQMVEDYYERKRLEKIYPKAFLQIRYEDLATNLTGTLAHLLKYMQMDNIPKLAEKMFRMMFNEKSGSGFTQVRGNATEVAGAWRKKIPKELKSSMDRDCQDVYSLFNYDL